MSCTAETGKLEKTRFKMYQNKTQGSYLKLYSFLFQSVPLLKKKYPAKNVSFFRRAPYGLEEGGQLFPVVLQFSQQPGWKYKIKKKFEMFQTIISAIHLIYIYIKIPHCLRSLQDATKNGNDFNFYMTPFDIQLYLLCNT